MTDPRLASWDAIQHNFSLEFVRRAIRTAELRQVRAKTDYLRRKAILGYAQMHPEYFAPLPVPARWIRRDRIRRFFRRLLGKS